MNGSMKACALYILHYINLHSYTLISSRNFEERKMLFFFPFLFQEGKINQAKKEKIELD